LSKCHPFFEDNMEREKKREQGRGRKERGRGDTRKKSNKSLGKLNIR